MTTPQTATSLRPRRPPAARLIAVAAALVVSAACGGDKSDGSVGAGPATSTTVAGESPAPAPPAPGAPASLTGLAADSETRGRPALMAKIDNAPLGRPQAGINQADVVIEEGVEGGITRLVAIYQSQLPESIGPVRSARTTDILIASALNDPLFAWSGSNGDFVKLVRAAPLVDVGVDVKGQAYRRVKGRPAPYNLFADPAVLYEGVEGGPPAPMFVYRAAGEASTGEPAAEAHVRWRDKVLTDADWAWDAGSSSWRRSQNGTAHVDDDGVQVEAANVVIQLVTYHDTGYRDQSNTMVPEADLVGEGEAWLLSDGKVVKGRWAKASEAALTQYTNAAGGPFKLTPGRTWVELPQPGNASMS